MMPKPANKSPRPGARAAFTLVELLVVIAIIGILLSITIPAVKSLTKGNAQKQAVNLLTAMIANARANALATHTQSGLVIYEDPSNKNQSAVQLIQASSTQGPSPASPAAGGSGNPVTFFIRAARTGPQLLPANVKVATIDSSGNIRNESSSANTRCRCILFDETGQMILRNGLGVSSTTSNPSDPYAINTTVDKSAAAWNLNATSNQNLSSGVSTPGLIVYDANEFASSGAAGNTTNMNQWLQQHADVIIVNAYTGNVIREK